MFDIGFQELVLIGLIGLVVVGPARLPKLARTVGLYINKMRRFVTDVRTDVERELHAEELRQSLTGNGEFDELKNVVKEARAGLDDVRSSVNETRDELSQATSTPADWSNPEAAPDSVASENPDSVASQDDGSGQSADAALPGRSVPDDGAPADGAPSDDRGAASSEAAVDASLAANASDEDAGSSQTTAQTTRDEPEPHDDVTTLNPRLPVGPADSKASTPVGPGVKSASGAASDGSVSRPDAPVPVTVAEDDDDEEPTVFNPALASKREARGKPD